MCTQMISLSLTSCGYNRRCLDPLGANSDTLNIVVAAVYTLTYTRSICFLGELAS